MSFFKRLTDFVQESFHRIPSPIPETTQWQPYRLSELPPILTLVCGATQDVRDNTAEMLRLKAVKDGKYVIVLSYRHFQRYAEKHNKEDGRYAFKAAMRALYDTGCQEMILVDETATWRQREAWCDPAWVRRFLYLERSQILGSDSRILWRYSSNPKTATGDVPTYTLGMLAPHESVCYTACTRDNDLPVGKQWVSEGYLDIEAIPDYWGTDARHNVA